MAAVLHGGTGAYRAAGEKDSKTSIPFIQDDPRLVMTLSVEWWPILMFHQGKSDIPYAFAAWKEQEGFAVLSTE